MVAVFAACAGGALWSMDDHGTPESPVVSAISPPAPEQSAAITATPAKSIPSPSPPTITAPLAAARAVAPSPSPTATRVPLPTPTATVPPVATPTPAPTATATSPLRTAAADPAKSYFCGGGSARITELDKRGPPEVVTITGAGDLTGWHLVSVRGTQRFDFPEGLVLVESVRVLSGEESEPDTTARPSWTGQNVWNNAEDEVAELYDCADRLVSAFDDGD